MSQKLLAAIAAAKSLAVLDGYARALWRDWGAGLFTDAAAQSLAETLEGRRREIRDRDPGGPPPVRRSRFPARRKAPRPANSRSCASSPMRRARAAPV
jgi:hypothetical protein